MNDRVEDKIALREEREQVTAWLVVWLAKEARRTPEPDAAAAKEDSGDRFFADAQRELTPEQVALLLASDSFSKTCGDLIAMVAEQLGHSPSVEELTQFTEDRLDLFGYRWTTHEAQRALADPETKLLGLAVEKVLAAMPSGPTP